MKKALNNEGVMAFGQKTANLNGVNYLLKERFD